MCLARKLILLDLSNYIGIKFVSAGYILSKNCFWTVSFYAAIVSFVSTEDGNNDWSRKRQRFNASAKPSPIVNRQESTRSSS